MTAKSSSKKRPTFSANMVKGGLVAILFSVIVVAFWIGFGSEEATSSHGILAGFIGSFSLGGLLINYLELRSQNERQRSEFQAMRRRVVRRDRLAMLDSNAQRSLVAAQLLSFKKQAAAADLENSKVILQLEIDAVRDAIRGRRDAISRIEYHSPTGRRGLELGIDALGTILDEHVYPRLSEKTAPVYEEIFFGRVGALILDAHVATVAVFDTMTVLETMFDGYNDPTAEALAHRWVNILRRRFVSTMSLTEKDAFLLGCVAMNSSTELDFPSSLVKLLARTDTSEYRKAPRERLRQDFEKMFSGEGAV